MISSLPISDPRIRYACVTNSEKMGHGVFSWHATLSDAEENAEETGGVAVPVDRINGEIIIPSRAQLAIDRFLRGAR